MKFIAAAGLAALLAVAPVAASAETAAPTAPSHHVQKHRGSYRSEMRNRHNAGRDRARASAEHVRQMRMQ